MRILIVGGVAMYLERADQGTHFLVHSILDAVLRSVQNPG